MKRHSAVIFPETVPDEQVLVPLVHVFQPLVYCQPVEKEPGEEEGISPLCNELVRHTLCRNVFPAPLGPDRDRFLSLLSDLRHRRDDYAAQLAHISLTGLGPVGRQKAETKSSIVSGLLKSHGIESERRDRKTMLLWQARLVLKLGEFMDEDQRILAREMMALTDREKGLFAELREDREEPFSLTKRLSSVRTEDDGMQRLRLKAWSRIFALGSSGPLQEHIFITRNGEAVDRLAEEHERTFGGRPEKLISLLLPIHFPGGSTMVAELDRFTGEAGLLLEELYGLLNGSMGKTGPREKFPAEWKGSWETILENHFPANACGRTQLTLYDFGRVSPRQVFLDSFGFDEDMLQSEPVGKAGPGIVIGSLTQL